jgi:hypothetical protein
LLEVEEVVLINQQVMLLVVVEQVVLELTALLP